MALRTDCIATVGPARWSGATWFAKPLLRREGGLPEQQVSAELRRNYKPSRERIQEQGLGLD